jgi:hypothetical protein
MMGVMVVLLVWCRSRSSSWQQRGNCCSRVLRLLLLLVVALLAPLPLLATSHGAAAALLAPASMTQEGELPGGAALPALSEVAREALSAAPWTPAAPGGCCCCCCCCQHAACSWSAKQLRGGGVLERERPVLQLVEGSAAAPPP